MYNSASKGYYSPVTDPFDATPAEGDVLPAPAQSPGGRPLYWHVFGGAIAGKRAGRNNFVLFTAGPVPKPADEEVRGYTIPGTSGETFTYIATFDYEPTDADRLALTPKEYR